MHHELKNKGFRVSHRRLVSIMRKNGIYHKYHRKYVKTTDNNHNLVKAEDLVKRKFDSFNVNEVWLYLASVADLGSRCLVGYKFSPTMDTNLICDALMMAIRDENPAFGTIFHSELGSQNCSYQFQELLSSVRFRCSKSYRGQCWANAVAESFWSILKRVCLPINRKFTLRKEGISKISNRLLYYNGFTPHTALGMPSPYQYRKMIFD